MAACDSLNAAQFMLREGDWKAIYYAVAGDDARFPPQLFNVSSDPWEMHDVAAAHPNVVASMDITLRGAIDYPRVMLEYEAQGREWGQRWTAAIGTGQDGTPGWRALLHSAFANFTAGDEAKFEGWLAGK
jgi:arylsulfatase A-like enzyme